MKIGRKYGEKEKIQILIKSLIFCILRIYIFSFYAFLFFRSLADAECLFPDAKMLKNISKYHVICHFPHDVAQMENAFTDVL